MDENREKGEKSLLERISGELQAIIDAVPDYIYVKDSENRFLRGNKAFAGSVDIPVTKLSGRSAFDLFPDETAKQFWADDLEVIRSGESKTGIVEEGLTENGTGWFSTDRIPFRNAWGDIVGVVGISRNITAQMEAVEELRASEEKYRALFEESRDSLLITTPEGKILDGNKAAIEMVGVGDKQELLKLRVGEDLYRDPGERDLFKRAMHAHGFVSDFRTEIRRRDGRSLKVIISGNVVYGENGAITAYRITIRDITEQEQLRDQLLHAQKIESIGVLAGGVAHDFNNILTPIMANVGFLQMKLSGDSMLQGVLEEILNASERARDLVRQILAFSRREETRRRPVMLQPIIKEVLKLMRATIPATVRIQSRIDSTVGQVHANASQIHQVLMNLLTNAHDAMRSSGNELAVILETVDVTGQGEPDMVGLKAGTYGKITVRDNGQGMDEVTASRVFEPYFTTKKAGEGSGLGLAVAHGIVSSHGGAMNVGSKPGEGTTVTVYLPVLGVLDEPSEDESMDLPGGTERILFVDDEKEILGIGGRILSSLGYRVDTFSSSVEALEAFMADPDRYDLIITDQTLPELLGSELVKHVLQVRPGMPIIICTGYSRSLNREKAIEIGARDLLNKPFTLPALARLVREVLDGPGA